MEWPIVTDKRKVFKLLQKMTFFGRWIKKLGDKKNYWIKWKTPIFMSLISILLCFIIGSIVIIKIIGEVRTKYLPVRFTTSNPTGGVFKDGDAGAIFTIKNYSNQEQAVSFLVYQHNDTTGEDHLFNLEHVYFFLGVNLNEEIENGVVKIPGGQSRDIFIEAKAKDSSTVLASRGAPNVEIVILDNR